ncbi:PKD domain-containing protein [Pollutibacter soli]|uniref:PKD domain-containing protein n=1 Tax=Pollutibacter soli TaxID=3034157 RepID=UPI0030137F23
MKILKNIGLWLLLSLGMLHANAQNAEFSADVTRQCAPASVNFTPAEENSNNTYFWDLGNGVTSTRMKPFATYINAGQYTVKLVVTAPGGQKDSVIKTNYITVLPQPVAAFDASDSVGCYPKKIKFTNNSTSDGEISSYFWDFGDGFNSNEKEPSHVYKFNGEFTVTLTVTTKDGCTNTVAKSRLIKISNGVKADFFAPLSNACKPPLKMSFTNLSAEFGTMTWQWNFGNDSLSDSKNPTVTYLNSGDFTVQLIAISNSGCSDTVRKKITIPPSSIQTSFTAPDTACVRQSVLITNTSFPDPDSSFWAWGDGTNSVTTSQITVNKTYINPGTYTIRLRNKFGVCIDSIVKTIVIVDTPKAAFTNSSPLGCKPPFTVKFTDQSTNGATYLWDFGDGQTSTEQNPSHIYNDYGLFNVSLTVTNRNGCKSKIVKSALVNVAKPVFKINNLPDSGCAPFTVAPDIDVDAIDGVNSYFWDFGNGVTSTQQKPSVTYTAIGNYTIKLVVLTKAGCRDSVSVRNIKVGEPGANAVFSASPLSNCTGQAINFTDQSTGNVTGWLWEFGDGRKSSEQNPIKIYSDTGWFDVTLTVFNNGCGNSVTRPQYINIKGPIGRFGYQIDCDNRRTMAFKDSSKNTDSHFWDFGDGTTSTIPSPTHTFPTEGEYNVNLTLTKDGCTTVVTKKIFIVNEKAEYTVTPDVICRGSSALFTAKLATPDFAVGRYQWDFGNGVYVDSPRVTSFTYTGFANGTYTTRLKITDYNGCFDSSSKVIKIGGPTAKFSAVNPTGCKGLNVNFNDESFGDGAVNIVNRIWDFGDGVIISTTQTSVQHQYVRAGTFSVKLKVVDAAGCIDSLVIRNLITTSEPKASFIVADSITCPGRPLQFSSTSTPASVNIFTWTFGDGSAPQTGRNEVHTYNAVGNYTVKLKIRDRFGCEDSITKSNFIKIDTPYAAFTISDSVGTCPPLNVKFKFEGNFASGIFWDFGDGGTNVGEDTVSHSYSFPGVYTAKLIVTSPGGCTDTAYKTITVYGPNGTFNYNPIGGCAPLQVQFNVTTQNVDKITYNFGNGDAIQKTEQTSVNYIYTDPDHVLPVVILYDDKGCAVPIKGKDSIKVIKVFPGFKVDSRSLCQNGSVTFTDTSKSIGKFTNWLWNFGDGQTSTDQHPVHYYSLPGQYTVTLTATTEFGCSETITKPAYIIVNRNPVTGITSSVDSICVNNTITFNGIVVQPDTLALTWSWNFGNGQTSTLQNPPAQLYTQSGNYNVQLITTNSMGCKDTVIYPINIQGLPLTDAGPDVDICRGQSVQLNATGAVSYQWTPATALSCTNCPNPTANPLDTTKYYVTGRSAFGCTSRDSIMVNVIQPSQVVAPPNDSLCIGQSLQLVAKGTMVYSWSPTTGLNNPNIANPVASPTTTTTYTVTGSDIRGCFVSTDTVRISVFPYPTVTTGADTTIQVGFSIKLPSATSSDVTGILWSPSVGLSCTTCPSPTASPTFNTTYTITVKNNGGCQASDAITVFVVCNDQNLFMPNTFSPNGDGMNEIFYPRGRGINTIRTLRIFNRWGQVVFEKKNFNANDPSAGWDGTFKGAKLAPDVYVYMMDLSCENNSIITRKGDVTLIR